MNILLVFLTCLPAFYCQFVPCEYQVCPIIDVDKCESKEIVPDVCNCCFQCSKTEGDLCGGKFGQIGKCGSGHYCQIMQRFLVPDNHNEKGICLKKIDDNDDKETFKGLSKEELSVPMDDLLMHSLKNVDLEKYLNSMASFSPQNRLEAPSWAQKEYLFGAQPDFKHNGESTGTDMHNFHIEKDKLEQNMDQTVSFMANNEGVKENIQKSHTPFAKIPILDVIKHTQILSNGECSQDDDCSKACTREFRPLCGNDQVTYNNMCLFEIAQCRNRGLQVISYGQCIQAVPEDDQCSKPCTREFQPMCGSDLVTYNNICLFEIAQCRNSELQIISNGECSQDDDCSKACTREFRPLCGNDQVTYNNMCLFEIAQCRNRGLQMSSSGACPSESSSCSQVCTREYRPVCGTDGVTYRNMCLFLNQKCWYSNLQDSHSTDTMKQHHIEKTEEEIILPAKSEINDAFGPNEIHKFAKLSTIMDQKAVKRERKNAGDANESHQFSKLIKSMNQITNQFNQFLSNYKHHLKLLKTGATIEGNDYVNRVLDELKIDAANIRKSMKLYIGNIKVKRYFIRKAQSEGGPVKPVKENEGHKFSKYKSTFAKRFEY